ncbi:MAG: trigger factor [Deltaproteobacteria bacterium]|nr:trigger factor [Deltaproteobacteria bacterium]MBW2360667.1 trigger factor [Deltaproteobacteria bacterium]
MTQDNASQDVQVESHEETPILHRVEVEVAAGRVKKAFDRAYRDLAKQAQVRGFRPGKVPRSVLERQYGASLVEQIEQTLVGETLMDAVQTAGLEAVAEPSIEASPPVPDASFRYTARIEVKPQVELPDLAGLPAQRPSVEVADDEVERELENLRERQVQLVEEPEGTLLADDHVATIDFVGRIDGEPFEGGSGQGVSLQVGAGQFIPGFEEQLRGAASGEDREVTVAFPDDYAAEQLAGKQAVFAAHVVEIKRREVPALDDEFAKDMGAFETLDELTVRIRGDIGDGKEREARSVLHRTLVDSLIERASFDVPPGMVEQQLQQRLESAHRRFAGQLPHEALHEQMARWREEWRGEAERDVREALLLEAVANSESLEVPAEDVEAKLSEMAEQQGVDATRLREGWGEGQLERALEGQLRDEKALEFLAAQAKVEETTDT